MFLTGKHLFVIASVKHHTWGYLLSVTKGQIEYAQTRFAIKWKLFVLKKNSNMSLMKKELGRRAKSALTVVWLRSLIFD